MERQNGDYLDYKTNESSSHINILVDHLTWQNVTISECFSKSIIFSKLIGSNSEEKLKICTSVLPNSYETKINGTTINFTIFLMQKSRCYECTAFWD